MKLVYYSQEDPRWRNQMYSNIRDPGQTIGITGCGPTAFAMVVSSLKGIEVLPPETAKYSVDHGYRTSNNGTAWALFPSIAKAYNLLCTQTYSLDMVMQGLRDGALAIASMSAGGHFTRGGHFIVLTGAHDGLIDVMDPNHDNDNYKWDGLVIRGAPNDGFVSAKESVFEKEARTYWIFSLKEEDKPMTAAERKQFDEMREEVAALKKMYEASEKQRSMPCPDWARPAIEAAQRTIGPDGNPIVMDADGGSYDFYRIVSVMHRAGLIK